MASSLTIFVGSGVNPSDLQNTQPVNSGLWLDNGVLSFWNGTENKPLDINTSPSTDLFNNVIQDI